MIEALKFVNVDGAVIGALRGAKYWATSIDSSSEYNYTVVVDDYGTSYDTVVVLTPDIPSIMDVGIKRTSFASEEKELVGINQFKVRIIPYKNVLWHSGQSEKELPCGWEIRVIDNCPVLFDAFNKRMCVLENYKTSIAS